MNSKEQLKTNTLGSIAWVVIALASLGVLAATYYFHFSGPVNALLWVGWLVVFVALGAITTQGKQFLAFAKEAKIELQKVVWPTRQETIQTTAIVMVMVAITGFVLWGVDTLMMWTIGKITHLG